MPEQRRSDFPMSAAARIGFMIGRPVAQTVLPTHFNAHAARMGLDALMVPLDMSRDALPAAIALLRSATNALGAVVTAPHKLAVMDLLDEIDTLAEAVGAVNLVTCGPGGALRGTNTDGRGFVAALGRAGVSLAARSALVLGCGGAGAAIAERLAASGCARVAVSDLDGARARALEARIGPPCAAVAPPRSVEGYDLIVNATTVGMDGRAMPHALEGLRRGTCVADVLTRPAITPFLARARELGADIQTGAAMAEAQLPFVLEAWGLGGGPCATPAGQDGLGGAGAESSA